MLPTRSLRVLALVTLALVAVACKATGPKATRTTFLASYSLFALSGAPAHTPTAISFLVGPSIANETFSFDVAVDIDSAGVTRLLPVRLVAANLAPAVVGGPLKRVGLQTVTGSFDALLEAPTTGYDTLNAKVVTPGTVVAFEMQEATNCLYDLGGTNIYAKLVIDSIKVADRRVFARAVVDPNCGFRQVMPDSLPTR